MPFPATKEALEAAGYRYLARAQCRSCKQPIEWWETPTRARMPLDHPGLRPHWATCPAASRHRQPRSQAAAVRKDLAALCAAERRA